LEERNLQALLSDSDAVGDRPGDLPPVFPREHADLERDPFGFEAGEDRLTLRLARKSQAFPQAIANTSARTGA
jgi:hypothetical protein